MFIVRHGRHGRFESRFLARDCAIQGAIKIIKNKDGRLRKAGGEKGIREGRKFVETETCPLRRCELKKRCRGQTRKNVNQRRGDQTRV